jgi:hypothetical protein
MGYNDRVKIDGTHDLFKLHDVRRYPFFYIELLYVVSTVFGIGMLVISGLAVDRTPGDVSPFWEAAASYSGVLGLVLVALLVAGTGFYGLFKGGYKWRARHMFGQFILRLYTTIGTLSVYGFFPTNWISGALLCLISGVIYLKLRWEVVRWKAYIEENA